MKTADPLITKLQNLLPKKSHIIFDYDKTIAQMEIDWSGWFSGVSKIYARFEPDHRFAHGVNPHEQHNLLVDKHGSKMAKLVSDFNSTYEQQHLVSFTPHQELVDLIKGLESHNLYVYSTNSRSTVQRGIDELGLANRFITVISRDDVTYVKPNPEGFQLIKDFEANKPSFLMIGDSASDKGAAQAAGIDFLESNYFEKYQFE